MDYYKNRKIEGKLEFWIEPEFFVFMRLCHPLWEGRCCIYPSALSEGFIIAFSSDSDDIFVCFGGECDTVFGYQSTASLDITLDRSELQEFWHANGFKYTKTSF
jgi:hypothetical protein